MRKSRFTEAQIIGMIKEQEAGMPTAEVCRKHGLSQGMSIIHSSAYRLITMIAKLGIRSLNIEMQIWLYMISEPIFDDGQQTRLLFDIEGVESWDFINETRNSKKKDQKSNKL